MQVGQEHGADLVLGDAPGKQVLIEKRDTVDEQIFAVVAQGQARTGLGRGKPGSATQHLDAHLYQAARHVVRLHGVGRFDAGVLGQVNTGVGFVSMDIKQVFVDVFDSVCANSRHALIKWHDVKKVFYLDDVAVLVFQRQFSGSGQPLVP